jgi:phosphoesterase RecJ-like protein
MTELPYVPPPRVQQLLADARSVLLATHENPDADGLGSLIACGLALPRAGRSVARLGDGPLPMPLDELPGLDRIPVDDGRANYDLAIQFDCRMPARLGDDAAALNRCERILVVDHHPPDPDEDSGATEWIVPTAPSATLLALSLICSVTGIEAVDPDVATNLYAGLAVDTGGFRHPSTTAHALRAGALLIDRGAAASEVTELLLHRRRPAAVLLMAEVMGSARYEADGQIVMLSVPGTVIDRCGALVEEAEGLVSVASAIDGVALAVMHLEYEPGAWRVSLRSHAPWEVNRIARAHGGGGHLQAAGFRARGDLPDLQAELLPELRSELAAGMARA